MPLRDHVHALEQRLDALRTRLKRRSNDPIHAVPFRGFGTASGAWIKGRVLEREHDSQLTDGRGVVENLRAMLRRYESDEIPGAKVEIRGAGVHEILTTDEEGYFEAELTGFEARSPWTELSVRVLEPQRGAPVEPATLRLRIPGPDARRLIISDVDDTVVKTGATNFLRHARTVLLNDAQSREPFDGVAAFYRALERGASGDEGNPIIYVSSSPWNLYDLFERFFETHEIPLGPILLKDFGIDSHKFVKEGHLDYKVAGIERILERYPDLKVVLLGDSGQKDAWVFEAIAKRHPDRIEAIYLRDLDPDGDEPEIAAIEERVKALGVPMMRVPDTCRAAEDACERGLIAADDLDRVRSAVSERHEASRRSRSSAEPPAV